jgi:integrase
VSKPVATNARRTRRTWGAVRKLPSGNYQASYVGPDRARYVAPYAFDKVDAADVWLAKRRVEIAGETWRSPDTPVEAIPDDPTLNAFVETWLPTHIATKDLKPRTQAHYQRLLDSQILPSLGDILLSQITADVVVRWYVTLNKRTPTMRAHSYSLLHTVMKAAVKVTKQPNPCDIEGAATTKRAVRIRPASVSELGQIVAATPERFRLLVLLTAWCALRLGEVTELRRADIDVDKAELQISRGVVRADGEVIVGTPKSDAGTRSVAIPPHLMPAVAEHLEHFTESGQKAMLFPAATGGHLAPSSLYGFWYPARHAAGRDDLRFHDLRHTGAVLAAATGATLAELMARLGHSTPAAAMRYQHAAADRDQAIAAALSRLATVDVPTNGGSAP